VSLLASLFVGKPLNILAVAVLFGGAHFVLRTTASGRFGRTRSLLVAAGMWALYAAWEWLVQVRTPQANIRVDLLLIWPVLLVASLVGVVKAVRPSRAS
jgi:hypothetical protein